MKHEVKLYDAIGGWGIRAKDFLDGIPKDADEITVRINSPGGDVGDAIAMYNALKSHPAHIVTVVDGYAASAASVVMLAGDERHVYESSIIMVHNPWTMAQGDARDMRHTADVLDEHGKALLGIYKDATGQDEDDLIEMMDSETWMRGAAALENGFATALLKPDAQSQQAAASVAWGAVFAALKNGKETGTMSVQKTRKEITEERDTLKAEVERLTADVTRLSADADARVAEATSAVAAQVEAKAQEIEAKNMEIADLSERLRTAEGTINELNESGKIVAAELVEAKAKVESSAAEIAAMKKTLESPAFKDAALQSAENLARAQADAEADTAEAALLAEAKAKEEAEKPSYAKWMAIDDPKEKRRYYLAHRDAIIATQDAEAEKGE